MSIDNGPKQMSNDEITELVSALSLKQGDVITGILLIAQVQDSSDLGGIGISVAATDDISWIDQLGMIKAAEIITVKELNE